MNFFSGGHKLLDQPYSPMTVRFFILQAHYRSTLDFSNEGLKAAEKGLAKLMSAYALLPKLKTGNRSTSDVALLKKKCYESLDDDMNTALVIANLFEGVRIVNSVYGGTETITAGDLADLKNVFEIFTFDILGLKQEDGSSVDAVDGLMNLLLNIRAEAKAKKDFAMSDKIRDELNKIGFRINDGKESALWTRE